MREHGSLLHWTAEYADIETFQLLEEARLASRNLQQKRPQDGFTAFDVAKARANTSPGWVEAFQDFMDSVDETRRASRTETRCFPTAFHSPLIDDSDSEEDIFVEAPEQHV